ncbi:disease resistance-like protein DSC1 [Mangifera indica]|uniref:disease resistance-like protein DSC1 n=1 Tax=Mangifera indica TaxID=29780 RepID=UPI001CF9567D|nr:disease resistance-like protein DSC1 [Mangifera indica]
MVPEFPPEILELYLDGTAVKELSSSIGKVSFLIRLSLSNCSSLESLPSSLCNLTSLRQLDLSGLSNLKMVPEFLPEILELYLDGTAVEKLSSSIGKVSSLIRFSLRNCSSLESLPNTIDKLKSLKYLCMSGCSKLERLPDDLGKLESLEAIEASGITVKELPSVMAVLSPLQFLKRLELNYCSITELPNNIDNLPLLVDLELEGNNFESIPTNIMNLSKLQSLNIRFCDRLQSLPKLPRNIKELLADGCKLLKELSGFTNLITPGPDRRTLSLFNCVSLGWDAIRNILSDSILDTYSSKINHFAYKVTPQREVEICYPGSDIPEWFNIQSSGSVIKLPQGSFNEKVLGLAFCFIVEVEDNCDECNFFGVGSTLRLSRPDVDRMSSEQTYLLTKCIKSDHVLVIYDHIIWEIFGTEDFKFACDTEAVISFHPLDSLEFTETNWIKNIKKCGVCLLFTEELEETMKRSGYSIHGEEDGFKSSNFYKGESSSRYVIAQLIYIRLLNCI